MTERPTYAYYPVFRRIESPEDPIDAANQLEVLLKEFAGRVDVRGIYSCEGFRPDADLMFWWTSTDPDALQELLVEFRRTDLGKGLDLTWSFLGVARPPEFNPQHQPAFLRGEDPKKYLCVYPFVRTAEWYLIPSEERAAMLREHGQLGREFADVLPNTTSGFGLGDWEWILAFEADELHRIVDCIRSLRDAAARRFTKEEVPFVVGIRKPLEEAVRDLT